MMCPCNIMDSCNGSDKCQKMLGADLPSCCLLMHLMIIACIQDFNLNDHHIQDKSKGTMTP